MSNVNVTPTTFASAVQVQNQTTNNRSDVQNILDKYAQPGAPEGAKASPSMSAESPKMGQSDMSKALPLSDASAETKPVAKEPDDFQSKLAMLAKREKMIRRQAEELKAREAALKVERPQSPSDSTSARDLEESLRKDPINALAKLGISYDDLTNAIVNQPGPRDPEMVRLMTEVDALKRLQSDSKTQFEEQQKRAYEQAVTQIRTDTKALTKTDPAFEMIESTGSHEAVVELIKKTFDTEGTLMTVQEAAAQVEEYLLENALSIASAKKVKAKLMPQTPAPIPEETGTSQPQSQPTQVASSAPLKTLTHAQALSSKQMTPYERAVLAFKGQLK